jgi:hypothetical protein
VVSLPSPIIYDSYAVILHRLAIIYSRKRGIATVPFEIP